MWSKAYPKEGGTPDQLDAYVAAAWMKKADNEGILKRFLEPDLLLDEYPFTLFEGWILGAI
jgi:hypothetical protein